MSKRIAQVVSFSCPSWIIKDLELEKSGNRSERIQELLIKGYMSEQHQKVLKKVGVSAEEASFPSSLSGVELGFNSSNSEIEIGSIRWNRSPDYGQDWIIESLETKEVELGR